MFIPFAQRLKDAINKRYKKPLAPRKDAGGELMQKLRWSSYAPINNKLLNGDKDEDTDTQD